ncbi:MAG TPA: hypothetical protein VF256_09190 [Streptosporangiaceae bacterium]
MNKPNPELLMRPAAAAPGWRVICAAATSGPLAAQADRFHKRSCDPLLRAWSCRPVDETALRNSVAHADKRAIDQDPLYAPARCWTSLCRSCTRYGRACSSTAGGYFKMFTARATTSSATMSDIAASAIMSLAQGLIAETSVALNAVAVVKERRR